MGKQRFMRRDKLVSFKGAATRVKNTTRQNSEDKNSGLQLQKLTCHK